MHRCRTMLLSMLALSATSAFAQDGSAVDDATRLKALETMNETASDNLTGSLQHEKELKQFIQENGLSDACSGDATGGHDMQMSFNKALEIAIKHEQMAPSDTTVDDVNVAREVSAYTNLAQSTWNKLQASMASVEQMSDCLHEHGEFDAYLKWSGDQAAAYHARMKADNEALSEQQQAKQKQLDEFYRKQDAAFRATQAKRRKEFLNTLWTQHKFESTQDLKAYKYDTQYGPNSYYNSYGGDRPYGYGGGVYGY